MRVNRYLTEQEKQREMEMLEERCRWTLCGRSDGVDIEMIPFLWELNELDGVMSLQSCIGHEVEGEDGVVYYNDGYLWVKLSEKLARRFYQRAFKLARRKGVERVYTLYSNWGEEIVVVVFNRRMNDRVLDEVLSFFESLVLEGDDDKKDT